MSLSTGNYDPYAPASPQQTVDAIAERMMLYRATKNGLLGYARAQGWVFPAELLKVDPDYVEAP